VLREERDVRRPLPEGTAGKTYSGKFLVRVKPEIHRKAALLAASRGESLNEFVAEAIAQAREKSRPARTARLA